MYMSICLRRIYKYNVITFAWIVDERYCLCTRVRSTNDPLRGVRPDDVLYLVKIVEFTPQKSLIQFK